MEELETRLDIGGIVRRRFVLFLLCFVPVLVISAAVAYLLPPVYRSKATILVEGQQIPEEYVKSTITGFVEERLQLITQQIMSRTKLLEIINQFGLYSNLKARYSTEEIVQKMREAVELKTVSAESKGSGRATSATIAFSISFEGNDPGTVQKVTNALASLYLEQNLKVREEKAASTTGFLESELEAVRKQIASLEAQISAFKRAHMGELPEQTSVNVQALERLGRDRDQAEAQMRAAAERKVYLEGQLATVEQYLPETARNPGASPADPAMSDAAQRLKKLRIELINLRTRFSDSHPDVIQLKREIAELEAQEGDLDDSQEKSARIEQLRGQLTSLSGRFGPQHPDVVKLSREIADLEADVSASGAEKKENGASKSNPTQAQPPAAHTRAVNPAYVNLQTQIATAELDIAGLRDEREKMVQKMAVYQARVEAAPQVERQYTALTRDYENAKRTYNDLLSKVMEARVSQGLEEKRQGERFTIIDPAALPESPFKPNRPAILLVGVVLALGAGVGAAAARESMDHSLKSLEDFWALTDVPVLGQFPLIVSQEESRSRRLRRAAWVGAGVATAAVGLFLLHSYWMPLDIVWLKLQHSLAQKLPM
jgi:succinoglycan biosynthesis transport protein ExoP